MVINRSFPYAHNCPRGGCSLCWTEYNPGPSDPDHYPTCCDYTENGQRVHVVIVPITAQMWSSSALQPETGARAMKDGVERDGRVLLHKAGLKGKGAVRKGVLIPRKPVAKRNGTSPAKARDQGRASASKSRR